MLNTPPRVSVVIPALNAAPTIQPCLASLVRQSESRWECVVVDDGSTDETLALAWEAAGRDPRVRVVTGPHRGLITALNEGLRHCRAPFVARMDADDVMLRDRLEAQLGMLERDHQLSGVGCHVRIFPRASMSPRLREYERWLNSLRCAEDVARDAYVECPIAHPSLMMRREMASLGYRECAWPEDYDLILRALSAGLRVGVVPRRLLWWRHHPIRLSRTDGRYDVSRFVECKAHYLAAHFLASVPDYVLWGYGGTGKALRRALAAHGKQPSHVVEVKPTRLGQRIHGAPVVPPDELRHLAGRRLVVSVAREGPRSRIRAALGRMGFAEGTDYVCAA